MTLAEFTARLPRGDLWVFGYGSLMWSPGFSYIKKARGRIHGYHRALCILSTRYRGTKRKPGSRTIDSFVFPSRKTTIFSYCWTTRIDR